MKLRKSTLVVLAALAVAAVFSVEARPFIQQISAVGTGTDPDQGSARNYAKENAESSLFCAGSLQNVRSVVSGCINSGSNDSPSWICTASARAECVIGR